LAITRAFGDFNLKSKGVTAEPFIKRIKIPKDAILVMASDGIWDVIDDQAPFLLFLEMFRILLEIKYH
jgi:serine/threonine protein phosphatase PrpC